jgi:amino acid transporter
MGGGGSKPVEPIKTKGEILTVSDVFGRTRCIITILIMSAIMLVLGAMAIKMSSQSGQTGAMACMVLFGFLMALSIYYFLNVDGQVIKITTITPGIFRDNKKEEDNKGEIYWSFEISISGMISFFLLLFLSFNQYNKASSVRPRTNAQKQYWKGGR